MLMIAVWAYRRELSSDELNDSCDRVLYHGLLFLAAVKQPHRDVELEECLGGILDADPSDLDDEVPSVESRLKHDHRAAADAEALCERIPRAWST